jgi:hypothetical protein
MTMMGDISGKSVILPENWNSLNPEQKRQWRLNRFVSGVGIKFVSPEAEQAYRVRAQRWVDAFNLAVPDRIPVSLPVGDLPFLLYGVDAYTFMHDPQKALEACQKFNVEYSAELEYYANPFTTPVTTLGILDYKLYAWPGHGLAVTAPGYQFLEGEYMLPEEYPHLIRDPSDFWLRVYLPRIFGAFAPFRFLQPLTNIIEMPYGQLMSLANPQVKDALRKLLQASDDLEKRLEIIGPYLGRGPANGYPVTMGPLTKAPFDVLGDTLRGTSEIMKDMYRRPQQILEACDRIADLLINNLLNAPGMETQTIIMFPLHKGADGWMSQKQFETFYFPTLKRVMDALINEGLIVVLFAEGSYNTRLESVNVFPRGSVCWYFDQTDMFRAKKLLGDKCSLMGNVPSSLMVTGDPAEVKEYCHRLIEGCGPAGYILTAGCMAENPKLDNLRAMLAAVKEYGTYRS